MRRSHNDNEATTQETRNDNDNNIDNDRYARARMVDRIADQLVIRFNNPDFREFYCKVAWKLSEARIWANVETAMEAATKKGTQPGRLFTYLCKRDGV